MRELQVDNILAVKECAAKNKKGLNSEYCEYSTQDISYKTQTQYSLIFTLRSFQLFVALTAERLKKEWKVVEGVEGYRLLRDLSLERGNAREKRDGRV